MAAALITTPVVRIAYQNLFKAVNSPLNPTRYKKNVTALIPKTDTEFLARFACAVEMEKARLAAKLPGLPLDLRATRLRDGDLPGKPGTKHAGKVNALTAGHWLLVPWCDPDGELVLHALQVDGTFKIATSSHDIYGGCWCKVSFRIYGYEKGSSPGLTMGLSGVVKMKDGERTSGGVSKEEIMEALGVTAPAAHGSNGTTGRFDTSGMSEEERRIIGL